MKPLALAVVLGLGIASPGEVAMVPLSIETGGRCVEEIETTIRSPIPIYVIAEGPNVLSFLRVEGPDRYRVEFEASGCPEGEVAKIGLLVPQDAHGTYPLKLLRAAIRFEGRDEPLVEVKAVDGKVKVR